MKALFTMDQSVLHQLYEQNKVFLIPIGTIIISIILLFLIIIPQIQEINNENNEITQIRAETQTLQSNAQLLSQIDDTQQTRELEASIQALPSEKDFAGILYAIRSASAKTGIGLGDFTFQVGDLSSKDRVSKDTPAVNLSVTILGGANDLRKFMDALARTSPISEVIKVDVTGKTSSMVVQFYYKTIPSLQFNYATPIVPVKGALQQTLTDINTWENSRLFDIIPSQVSSESASPFR